MHHPRKLAPSLLLLAGAGLLWSAAARSAATAPAAWQTAPLATAAFLRPAVTPFVPPPAAPGAPLLGLPSSAIPGPAPMVCSVDAAASNPSCSAMDANSRCSALCDGDQECSVFNFLGGNLGSCSTFKQKAGCSVLLPSLTPPAGVSQCSAFGDGNQNLVCSVMRRPKKQGCSVQNNGQSGQGQGECSVFTGTNSKCSVFNLGASDRSFCTAFFDGAKRCSAFGAANSCSVEVGAKGVCTILKGAAPFSCSAYSMSICSVINQTPGSLCQQ